MALLSPVAKRTLSITRLPNFQSLSSTTSSSSSPTPPSSLDDETAAVVSTAVSILKHHRSKSRWTHVRSLFPTGFTPTQFSQITLQVRNNPHLALNFFNFTIRHSLCPHTLSSYSTIIHTLCRSRLKTQSRALIQSAIRKFEDTHIPISALSSNPNPPKIFQTLVKTYRACDSAPFVFDLLIESLLESKRIDQSVEIVRMLRSRGIFPLISTCNSLIRLVSKCRGCHCGYDLYREVFRLDCGKEFGVNSKVVVPNAHTFNVLMLAFYREGLVEDVEKIWEEMLGLNCAPNVYSYSVRMAAYCEVGRMVDAVKVWEEMEIEGVKHDVAAYNTIIGGFCKIGEVARAEEFFREMALDEVESTCVTFEHLVNGYCKIGNVDSAMLLYKDLCRAGFVPESLTVDAVIRELCGKSLVSEALEFLRAAIKRHDVVPRRTSYEFLIKGLCHEGRMEEASKLQLEMFAKGYEPNSDVYSYFIEGYVKQGNEELAGKLQKEMLETQKPEVGN